MAKFKVGDKVKVVRSESPSYSCEIGKVGAITESDDDYSYPYVIAGVDGAWCDEEVELVDDETVVASGVVSIDYTVASAVVLVGDTHVASKLREYARNGEEIEVVVRVKRKETK